MIILEDIKDDSGETIAWRVELKNMVMMIDRNSIIRPDAPSFNAIRFAAINQQSAQSAPFQVKKRKQSKTNWTKDHELLVDDCRRHRIDIDKAAALVDDSYSIALAEFETHHAPRNAARIYACRILHAKQSSAPETPAGMRKHIAKLENSGRDAQSIIGFDDVARLVADAYPELSWDSWDCAQELVELLRETPARKPSRRSAQVVSATIDRVFELESSVDMEFAEWNGDADSIDFAEESDFVPF